MGKIICEVCGTSYSEAATQCPICGCVRPESAESFSANDNNQTNAQSQYQYVRGGRFSKSNVKKRNKQRNVVSKEADSKAVVTKTDSAEPKAKEKNEASNRGLVITVLVLLLAIIAVTAYIAVTFVIPVAFPKNDVPSVETDPTYVNTDLTEATQDMSCTDIVVDPAEVSFSEIGETVQILVTLTPVDTTDVVRFTSSDVSVASVDETGMVTSVGAGEAEITIECGTVKKSCFVSVPEPEPEFAFNREDITFTFAGEEWLVYSGSLSLADIVWSTDDETIATITDGKIVAVGNGVTSVHGEYNGILASCIVRCDFEDATEEVTEPVADNGPYRLDNPYGVSDTDASIYVGGSFTLYLLDKDEQKVSDVTWTVEEGSCCTVDNGTVTGISKGQAKVVATYGGESYTCIVRVS